MILLSTAEGKPSLLFLLAIGLSLWVSLGLIFTMWIKHRDAGLVRKIFWTILLTVPVYGPIMYLALFKMPGTHTNGGGNGGMPMGGESAGH